MCVSSVSELKRGYDQALDLVFNPLTNEMNEDCQRVVGSFWVWGLVESDGFVKGCRGRGNPQQDLKNKGVIDSRCSRHMTGNRLYLTDYEEIDGGFVAFGGNSKGEKITKKGKIRTGKLDFEDVYFVKELKFNLFSVSQMCDKKNNILFTDTECVVLSPYFKLTDESHVLLKFPRKDNMYSVDLRMVILKEVSLSLCQAHQIESNLCIELDHGIKREFVVARTPQQNGVAERKNRTLIEAARTMLADSKLPTTFWAEAVNTACYVQNKVLVIKPHNKTPYELFLGRKPALSFMRPFGCPVTILNTIDHLGKFDGKADEGFFVGYSTNSKAFIVFNSRTRIVEENLHVQFSENTPNIAGSGPNWLFDIDALTKSMNYKPIVAGNQSNGNAGTKACDDAGKARMETLPGKDYILLPMWPTDPLFSQNLKDSPDAGFKPSGEEEKKDAKDPGNESGNPTEGKDKVNAVDPKTSIELPNDPNIPELEDIVYSDDDEDVGAEADMNNLNAFMPVIPIPTTRIHKDHPVEQIIRDLHSAPQTRRMTKNLEERGLFSSIEATQDELLQFKLQKVWTLVDLPNGKRAIGTKWVYRNKKDERAIRLFLAYASFKDFVVYQMDVKSAFLYGKIEEEVYVCQPPGFEDLDFPNRVYKVEKVLYELHQAPRAWTASKAEGGWDIYQSIQVYGEDVDEHLYRSMIRSLMYLTSSRPDIMFAVCACARFQVNPKSSHLHAVKRIFRYLKGQPKLGLWYPKDSPFDLVAYTDSDYAGASLDRKSTIGGCQFLGCRLISWQCKKQTVVANSTTEAEYIAASNCCGQVLWIQNQLLDYGYNFMQTKIHIDNESTICIVKNPVFHSKTKHIEIRHHFIRDSYEKKLIQMIKIHTDQNVADLLTKAFDVSRFQYLIASIGMLNL
ncbi:putative ribonuclease H-like domain-containing protein [Tanacetum coccineum]